MAQIVAVGMSGGVDSSVAALLLQERGFEVIGIFMKNWEEEGECSAAVDYRDALAVCDSLSIPCYAFNFSRQYYERVFDHFLEELKQGRTPNPDILCNREIKFDCMWKKAQELGADYLATGHYVRTDGKRLLKAVDPGKDQSYFLYTLTCSQLPSLLFPIGELYKHEVREKARQAGLVTSGKRDSVGICFIGKRNFKEFVSSYLPYQPGEMVTPEGKSVGTHSGVAFYTVGQRHGLAIGGAGEAWFVADKQIATNRLIVVQGEDHPALFHSSLTAHQLSWVSRPLEKSFRCSSMIRYRQQDERCHVTISGDRAEVIFDRPQRAITIGQAVVFYDESCCLGGGSIIGRG